MVAAALLVSWGVFYPRYMAKVNAENKAILEQQKLVALQKMNAEAGRQPAADAKTSETKGGENNPEQTQSQPVTASLQDVPVAETFTIHVSNDIVNYSIDALTGSVNSAKMLSNRYLLADKETPIELFPIKTPHSTFELVSNPSLLAVKLEKGEAADGEAVLVRTFSNGLQETRHYKLDADNYLLHCNITLKNPTSESVTFSTFGIGAGGLSPLTNLTGDKVYSERMNLDYCNQGGSIVNANPQVGSDDKFAKNANIDEACEWVSSSNKFFASILLAEGDRLFSSATSQRMFYFPQGKTDKKSRFVVPSSVANYGEVTIPAGSEGVSFNVAAYCGPKEMGRIRALHGSAIGIMHISYYSWFEFIARPMLQLLNWLYSFCKSYGISIILLTLIVRIVFWPITQKANNSMRRMQKSQPKMQAVRDKYKTLDTDTQEEIQHKKEMMNREMMELYRKEGINPAGGCLPILLQIPVFIALYSALDSAVELRHVSFLWCTDLARPDLVGPQLPFSLPLMGQIGLHPLVIIMTALMLLQQKMTPSGGDPNQKKMMMLMPIIMLFMLYNLPSGLTLYWTVSQIFSILQMKYGQIIKDREDGKGDTKKIPAKA